MAPRPEAGSGSLAALMAERFERYRDTVVRSFYRDHFSRFDRQIVLVDLLGALNRGRACFDDVEAALGTVLRSFRYGPSGLLARLFRPRIEALLFAASKADHVAHNQHHNLRLLLERMVARGGRQRALRGHQAGLRLARGAALDRRGAHRPPRPGAVLRARHPQGREPRDGAVPGRDPARSAGRRRLERGPLPLSRLRAAPPRCCRALPSRSTSASTRRSRCCSATACNERAPAGRALRARSGEDRARAHRAGRAGAARCRWWPRRPPARRHGGPGAACWCSAAAGFLAALLGLEAYDFVAGLFERSDLLGSAFSLLLALAAAGAIGLGASEIASLRRLDRARAICASPARIFWARRCTARPIRCSSAVEGIYRDRPELQACDRALPRPGERCAERRRARPAVRAPRC